ncbi:MAG: hypothetical protein LQ349_001370 [Xanthoria aureola]|nr:MAG: hypothetical protein LQ349_001370 [Xanthoria aureola]
MPSPPHTPTRHRRFSNLNPTLSTPRTIQYSPVERRSGRSSSIRSITSTVSLKSPSAPDCPGLDLSSDSFNYRGESDGLGNLADELAEAWDTECGGNIQMDHVVEDTENDSPSRCDEHQNPWLNTGLGIAISAPQISNGNARKNQSLSPPKHIPQEGLYKTTSDLSLYDSSDYGENPDLEEVQGISTSLEHRLASIESIARRGAESNGSGADTVVMRVAESLRDLASQAGVESGASRLTTAHTAVSSSLMHQTRFIQTLSSHFTSPLSYPPSLDEIDDLLPLLVATLELIPRFSPHAVLAIHSLHCSALELISTLSVLADSLHMIRQTTSFASRRLKAAKDAVEELRTEARVREEGIRWVEGGNWDQRLRNRECGNICEDVVGGFREVCEWWEQSIRKEPTNLEALEMEVG